MGCLIFHRSMGRLTAAAVVVWCLHMAGAAAAGAPATVLSRSSGMAGTQSGGMAGDLVVPAGAASRFSFDSGRVVIGEGAGADTSLPRQRYRNPRAAAAALDGPRVRLLLNGVVDASGTHVTSANAQLVIDATVSPSSAARSAPPFIFALEINEGSALLEASLPVEPLTGAPVRLQIIGVSVLDPGGQPFAVLGFELPALLSTPVPETTPTPTTTPKAEGHCFRHSACNGASISVSEVACCQHRGTSLANSWCPAEAFDPATGQCAEGRCLPCEPAPTPTAEPCADSADCAGPCSRTCDDGTVVAGECTGQAGHGCECSALCSSPTPCGIGECFDTNTQQCTGQPCDSALHCPLPGQICDVGGRRCPCRPSPPPLPRGQICCQCKERTPSCFDFSFAEVQPICPPGCETFLAKKCDAASDSCVPLAPCASDKDCSDGNPCTIDRCTANGCTHDCVCLGGCRRS